MPKRKNEWDVLPLFKKFIIEIKKGKHIQSNGTRIKKSSIRNYENLERLLYDFSIKKGFMLRFKLIDKQSKNLFEQEKKYWREFYIKFTGFLYEDLNNFDNYVGSVLKLLKAFFNYLLNEKGMAIGNFHKKFYCPSEETEIVVLTPEQLNYLIYSKDFENKLSENLKKVKDIFVFGCSVGLRYSDLSALSLSNVEIIGSEIYIRTSSKKTQKVTRVVLPDYSVKIINKYQGSGENKLLPSYSDVRLNSCLKRIMQKAGWTHLVNKIRRKRGIPVTLVRDKKQPYRFCDLITTHTMRRTAITNMLSLGVNEQLVRKISGHAANSKEFYKYVSFAQTYIDNEVKIMHQKMKEKHLQNQV